MRADVLRDLTRSARDFVEIVWPVIAPVCGGGRLEPVELQHDHRFARDLDVLAGVDAWQVSDGRGIRGIASRVQYGSAWPSFTIRAARTSGAETELAKRLAALNEDDAGWLLPGLSAHAYLEAEGGPLLVAYVCETRPLYRYLRDGGRRTRRTNPADGNEFLVVWIDDLRTAGVEVREVSEDLPW